MTTAWETMLNRQLEYASRPLTRLELLVAHLDHAWDRARPRVDGVTDDEYFWEPAPDCWTVRRQPDGTCMTDWASPEPNPSPFTTIAWRLAHIGMFLNMRANHRFGDRTFSIETVTWPRSANAALDWIDQGFLAYRNGVAGVTDADLDIPPDGPAGWLDTRFPFAMNIQHITLELIHHGAEVALLRDLYCARDGQP